jgi:hypothetical protein
MQRPSRFLPLQARIILSTYHSVEGRNHMSLIDRLLSPLRNTTQPMLGYGWKAGLISLIPSLAISTLLNQFLTLKEPPGLREGSMVQILFGVLILSPWLETLLLWFFLWLLHFWIDRPVPLALASALIWSGMHSLATPL